MVKDLLSSKHSLMQPLFGAVSSMEAFIGPLQFAAVVFNITGGLPVLVRTFSVWGKSMEPLSEQQWLAAVAHVTSSRKSSAASFIAHDVKAAFAESKVQFWTACCDMIIGSAFTFLFLDSMHISMPICIQWALIAMELALLYILTVIADGAIRERTRAADMQRLALALQAGDAPLDSPAVLPLALNATHSALGTLSAEPPTAPWKTTQLEVADPLGTLAVTQYITSLDNLQASLEKEIKANKAKVAQELLIQSFRHRWQARLSWAVFLLNAIAFLGYAVFPVTFLAPSEKALQYLFPFWHSNSAAEWHGNFAGDVAWTIEPFLLLLCPVLIERACNRMTHKKKAD